MGRKHRASKSSERTATLDNSLANAGEIQSSSPRVNVRFADQPMMRFVITMSHWLGSLQMAVISLTLFMVVMALGTMLESWYSAKLAQEMVYHAWWFTGLLLLLAVNIFFAAAKKWPWKKHQTGFLITHLGLITMLAGGVWTALEGTDAQISLLSSDDVLTQREVARSVGFIPHRSNEIYYGDQAVFTFKRAGAEGYKTLPFEAGSLPWGDQQLRSHVPLWLRIMDWLAHPQKRSWRSEFEPGVFIEVTAFHPHARKEPYSSSPNPRTGFPALKLQLFQASADPQMSLWLALDSRNLEKTNHRLGGGMMEILGTCPEAMIDEFLKPPADDQRGAEGQLVLKWNDQTWRLDVAKDMGKKVPLGSSGYAVQLTRYLPNDRYEDDSGRPIDPAVEFVLIKPDGKSIPYHWTARSMVDCGPVANAQGVRPRPDPQGPAIWYHPPDWRFGIESNKALLQFVVTDKQQLYYRSFSSRVGSIQLENQGRVEPATEIYDIWGGMKWRFRVDEFLPLAMSEERFIPVAARPGLDRRQGSDPLEPLLEGKISIDKTNRSGKIERFFQTFQLPQGAVQEISLEGVVDGARFRDDFVIGFNFRRQKLDFELRLLRAESQVDPGTNSPATYTSFVQLTDPEAKIFNEHHMITMNAPLNYKGYKIYQADMSFVPVHYDQDGKPVRYSVFTVGRDPGLWLKYIGSSMLALGIACMYYMKAYFFKPRTKTPAAQLA